MVENLINLLGRAVGLLSLLLMVVGFIMLIRQIKKSNRLRASSLLMSMVFSILMLIFNAFILRSTGIRWWYVFLLIFGAGFGIAWGKTTSLDLKDKKIMGKRSIGYLLFWLFSLIITQLLGLFAQKNVVAFGMVGMFFSTGISMGTNSNILFRIRQLLRNPEPITEKSPEIFFPQVPMENAPKQSNRKKTWLIVLGVMGSLFLLAVAVGILALYLLSNQGFSLGLQVRNPEGLSTSVPTLLPEENDQDDAISAPPDELQISAEERVNSGINTFQAYLYINGTFEEEFTTTVEINFLDEQVCLTENGEKECLLKTAVNEYTAEDETSRISFNPEGFIWYFSDQEGEAKVFFTRVDE